MSPSLSHIPFTAFHLLAAPQDLVGCKSQAGASNPIPIYPQGVPCTHKSSFATGKKGLPEPFISPPPPSTVSSQRPPPPLMLLQHLAQKRGSGVSPELIPAWVSTGPAVVPCLHGMGKDGEGNSLTGGFDDHVEISGKPMGSRSHQSGCSAKDQTQDENLGMHRRTRMSLGHGSTKGAQASSG